MNNAFSILVVDDEAQIRKLLEISLEANQYKVLFAVNGKEGIAISASHQPDLILLDINMPILDGWQFLEEYKTIKNNLSKDIVINILTSSDDKEDLNKAELFKEEIHKYYTKPVTVALIKDIFQ